MLTQASDAGAVRRGYQQVCRTIRLFLDATLKGDVQAAKTLEQVADGSPVTVRFQPARGTKSLTCYARSIMLRV